MKCPWMPVQTTTYSNVSKLEITVTEFSECYKGECPFYSPERKFSANLSIAEYCTRTKQKEDK